MAAVADLDELAARLDGLAEDVADAAIVALREAVEAGGRSSALERRLTRARRSIERAAQLLREHPDASED